MTKRQPTPRRRFDLAKKRATNAINELNDLARELGWPGIFGRLENLRDAMNRVNRTQLPK